MRYIPVNCLKPGVVIGKTLFNQSGQVLLTGGTLVKEQYIDKIKTLGVKGIFIEDEISKDIDVYNAISEELRQDAVKSIRKLFNNRLNPSDRGFVKKFNKQAQNIAKMVESIVDDILAHRDTINNVMDIKVFDEYTYYHCTNVAVLSVILGTSLDMTRDELKQLAMCGILHDVGKVFTSNYVLNKPEALNDDEFELIRTHSLEGFNYIKDRNQIDYVVSQGVLDHHEKFDGTGYPNGKKGKNISLFGRIISVADVYDALTSDRVYRNAWSPAEAIEYIMANNTICFDPEIVTAFIRKIDPYPVGTAVELSTGDVGIVTAAQPNFPMRPDVRIFMSGGKKIVPYEIKLAEDKKSFNITILRMAKI